MFRKFTISLSLILASVALAAFTPAQEGTGSIEILGLEVLWWFWLCFVSILIVGLFIWLMLVAGRRDVEAPTPPEPPMAGRKPKADLSAGATASTSKRVVDTTEATMADTKYVVTDPDAKYVKGSLSGEVAEESQAESNVVSETEAMVEEVSAEVSETEATVTETVVVEEAKVEAETTPVIAEVKAEAEVVETVVVEETADTLPPAVVAPAAAVEEKPAKKASAKKKGRKSSKYGEGRDDLKKVEGIGPKIESHLNADGIMTFEQLANANIERIQGILNAAGPRYRTHKPDTWPEQAALCAKGAWDALEKLQDELDGGRRK